VVRLNLSLQHKVSAQTVSGGRVADCTDVAMMPSCLASANLTRYAQPCAWLVDRTAHVKVRRAATYPDEDEQVDDEDAGDQLRRRLDAVAHGHLP